ncbi:MAG: DUF3619 family protein [Acidovorax sp.]|jgi:hypothetical protein|nr:DUF3619 family protein [Acidovorax sp.]
MNTASYLDSSVDQFGRKIAARLTAGEADLPYVVTERLRASREQALSVRKRDALQIERSLQEAALHAIQLGADGSATLGSAPSGMGWGVPQWLRTALTALPIAAMVAGIAFIGVQQDSSTTTAVAELDTELLTAPLPPDAYTDAGFIQYLQSQPDMAAR